MQNNDMKNWIDYISEFKDALKSFEFDEKIENVLKDSHKKNQKIFIAGNGGSASLANHYACDFQKPAGQKLNTDSRKRYSVLSLVNNIDFITAISNDSNYEYIFEEQLRNIADSNDILIMISSSGNSKNIINALNLAKEIGMITIGICGFKGGYLYENVDYKAYVPIDNYYFVEDIHGLFGHYLAHIMNN